jgi:aryl-alcohol dehydrogenase-like predicted oxidoreductase
VAEIGLGCVTFGREISRDDSFRVLDHAFERGITFFDTAEAYGAGASERVLGEWTADRGVRDAVTIETKILTRFTRAHLREALHASLDRLRTARVDVYLLHQPDPSTPLEETIEGLAALTAAGLFRRAGSSNFPLPILRHAHELAARLPLRFDVTQPNYNLASRTIEGSYLEFCRANNVEVVSYSPLGAGFLTGKYRPDQPPPSGTRFDVVPGHRDLYFSPENFAMAERLRALAAETGTSTAQLALRWVFENHAIARVLVGARDTRQVDTAIEARRAVFEQRSGDVRLALNGP